MSRIQTGKSSLARLRFNLVLGITVLFIPVWIFTDPPLFGISLDSSIRGQGFLYYWKSLLIIYGICLAWGWVSVTVYNFLQTMAIDWTKSHNPDYLRWKAAGGHPFYDILPPPLNNDPDVVRMAIGTPPQSNLCQVCGFQIGRNFGNRCANCGTYGDR
jgi:hypothetical protein